jgi:mannan endo-1,4-beta-mannosidase
MFSLALTLLLGLGSLALAARPASNIPKTDGLFFSIDGAGKYHAGTNAYWLAFLEKNSDVDLVLDHMAAANLTILRIWGFNDVNEKPQNGRQES